MELPTKKVLFTSHTANFSKFNRPFMQWFRDHNYEVHYASAGEEEVTDCDKHFTVPFARSPFKLSNLHAIKKLKTIIDKENYDLIHTHTPMGSVVTRLAAIQARKHGTRVIYTAHGFHFFTGAALMNWLIYYPVEKIMSKYTDTLITINSEDYARARKRFTTEVYYVPGVGVNLKKFHPLKSLEEKNDLRKKFGFDSMDLLLICVAELNNNKNQAFLINQMPSLILKIPSVKLILCGTGDLEQEYAERVKVLGLQDSVFLLGYRKDVELLYRISDICVTASRREGLGLNLVEAAASGLPLVASNNRGHRDIISQEGCFGVLYNLNDSKDYINCIASMLDVLQSDIDIAAANATSLQHYSLPAIVKRMSAIYRKYVDD